VGDFSDAAGEREMELKCGSLPRGAGDLVGLMPNGENDVLRSMHTGRIA